MRMQPILHRTLTVAHLLKIFPACSLLCLQHLHTLVVKPHFNIVLTAMLMSTKWPLSFGLIYVYQTSLNRTFLVTAWRATCPAHITMITLRGLTYCRNEGEQITVSHSASGTGRASSVSIVAHLSTARSGFRFPAAATFSFSHLPWGPRSLLLTLKLPNLFLNFSTSYM
jgi:hypothetical protein